MNMSGNTKISSITGTEDYYLGKREWEYPKMSLSGLRDFCEGRKT